MGGLPSSEYCRRIREPLGTVKCVGANFSKLCWEHTFKTKHTSASCFLLFYNPVLIYAKAADLDVRPL
ncbi:MAG: hypothetical protein AAF570_07155, partial [Bacteroidota bacterium]